MGTHNRATSRFRLRAAVGTGAVLLGTVAAAGTAVAAPADGPGTIDGTPCDVGVRACVDLDEGEAWLIRADGRVERGPVEIGQGDDEDPTPVGTFAVDWKNKDHRSAEYDNEPMPYSVFFAPGGIAFHEGELEDSSAGCVRLEEDDAKAFFATLQVGDKVQVKE